MIIYKGAAQIESMRRTGRLSSEIILKMRHAVAPGITTAELDAIAADELRRAGAVSASKNYPTYRPGEGFPGYTCICVNDEVVHGVPGPRILMSGDIVTLDVNPTLDGFCASAAATVPVGNVSTATKQFLKVGANALLLAIDQVRPDRYWHEVATMIQQSVETHGYEIVREFGGHGIGRRSQEQPFVSNFVTPGSHRGDFKLRPGMTITIEPMITMGRRDVVLREDGWTVVTEDGMPAAHFRHTIAVTRGDAEILTL